MSSTPSPHDTTICFRGVEINLPHDLPFSHSPKGTLTLDFRAGYTGKLHLRAGALQQLEGTARQQPTLHRQELQMPKLGNPTPQRVQPASLAEIDGIIPDSQANSMADIPWFNRSPLNCSQASPDKLKEGTSKSSKAEEVPEKAPSGDLASGEGAPDVLDPPAEVGSLQDPPSQAGSAPDSKDAAGSQEQPPKGGAAEPGVRMDALALQRDEPITENSNPDTKAKLDKENTPAAANRKAGKRKSDGGQPSTGKRSGKKGKKSTPGPSEIAKMSFQWKALDCKGSQVVPDARWGATFTPLDNSKVFLYGGNTIDAQLGDSWYLDVAAPAWQQVSADAEQAKAWHQTNFVRTQEGGHLYTIGGERDPPAGHGKPTNGGDEEEDAETECLSEVCEFDLEAKLWVALPMSGGKVERSGHSSTLLPDDRILVFGGIDNDGKYHNDSHIYDLAHLDSFSLSGSIVRGAPPKPRAYHSATLVGRSIIVLGGTGSRVWSLKEVYSLDIDTWLWKEHTADVVGDVPPPRCGHTVVALPGDRYLLVFGGGIPEQDTFFGTASVLDTYTWLWSNPLITGVERPRGRSGHGMAVVQLPDGKHVVAMHGGRTQEQKLCKDTWILESNA